MAVYCITASWLLHGLHDRQFCSTREGPLLSLSVAFSEGDGEGHYGITRLIIARLWSACRMGGPPVPSYFYKIGGFSAVNSLSWGSVSRTCLFDCWFLCQAMPYVSCLLDEGLLLWRSFSASHGFSSKQPSRSRTISLSDIARRCRTEAPLLLMPLDASACFVRCLLEPRQCKHPSACKGPREVSPG